MRRSGPGKPAVRRDGGHGGAVGDVYTSPTEKRSVFVLFVQGIFKVVVCLFLRKTPLPGGEVCR